MTPRPWAPPPQTHKLSRYLRKHGIFHFCHYSDLQPCFLWLFLKKKTKKQTHKPGTIIATTSHNASPSLCYQFNQRCRYEASLYSKGKHLPSVSSLNINKHNAPYVLKASLVTHLVRQHLLPERPTEIQRLQHRVTVAGVPELEKTREGDERRGGQRGEEGDVLAVSLTDTYVDQSEVVFINGKLFRSNLLFQGRGIGALKREERRRSRKKI